MYEWATYARNKVEKKKTQTKQNPPTKTKVMQAGQGPVSQGAEYLGPVYRSSQGYRIRATNFIKIKA